MRYHNQKGYVLAVVILASLILGGLSTDWLMQGQNASRSRQTQSRRDEIMFFKLSLMKSIDCGQTTAGINPAVQCRTVPAGNNGVAVTLKADTGDIIAPGNVRGQFAIQAFCREKVNSSGNGIGQYYVSVRSQVTTRSGSIEYDPGLRRNLDFTHPANQLFTASDSLCTSALAGTGTPTAPTTYYKVVEETFKRGARVPVQPNGGGEGAMGNGVSYGSGDCYVGAQHGADYAIPLIRPSTPNNWFTEIGDGGYGGRRTRVVYGYRWRSNPRCPAGYKAIAGGANCKAFDGYSWFRNGLLVGSRPDDDGNGWIVQCCGRDQGIAAGGTHPTIKSWVGCVLETGPP